MKEIYIDFSRGTVKGDIKAIQGDNTNERYKIILLNNYYRYDITGKTLRMALLIDNDRGKLLDLTVTNSKMGEAEISITNELTSEKGIFQCQLAIFGENEYLENSITFNMFIRESILNKISGGLISNPKFDTILNTLTKVQDWDNYFKDVSPKLEEKYTERLNTISSQLSDIMINFEDNFKRQVPEGTDRDRLKRAIASVPEGATLYFTNDLLVEAYITIDKPICFLGKRQPIYDELNKVFIEDTGTLFKNASFILESNSISFEKCAVDTYLPNGFQANTVSLENLRFKNVSSKAKSHSFLFESYKGKVEDVVCENCCAYDGTHGFISKTNNVKFLNCYAKGMTFNGFGFISDNIPQATEKGLCYDNILDNCYARECQLGFNGYARDMFSDVNVNLIFLSDITLNNCTADKCDKPFSFGEATKVSGTKFIVPLQNIVANNIIVKNTKGEKSVYFANVKNSKFGGSVDKDIDISDLSYNIDYNINSKENISKINEIQIFSNNSNLIKPVLYKDFTVAIFQNTQSTIFNRFNDAVASNLGKYILLKIEDDFTEIQSSGGLSLINGIVKGRGSWILLKREPTFWREIIGYRINS